MFLAFSTVVFILLMNVKMPTIVGILTFISMINFMFSRAEFEKKLYNIEAEVIKRFFMLTSTEHEIPVVNIM